MADESSLRFIGFSLGVVTAVVTLIAAFLVVSVDRNGFPKTPVQTASTVSNSG